jgi:hypothetical protein
MNLLSSFGKKGVDLGLLTKQVDIEDTIFLSKYFVVAEFNTVFTAGKNPISFNGSTLIRPNSEIQVECIDSNGNPLFMERPKSQTQFQDVATFVISIHVYNETQNGPGKLILVGTTNKGEIVRWVGNITIDKTVQNFSKVRFYNTPTLEVRPLLYPVIANDIGSQLTKQVEFTSSFYSYAATPARDSNRQNINPKTTDIDYRLVLNQDISNLPQLYPTRSFNTQMEGQTISINTVSIQAPFSYIERLTNISASFKIKRVINSTTLQLSDAFYSPVSTNQIVTNINNGSFTSSYKWVAYNTQSDQYQKFSPVGGSPIFIKNSYAEVVYRNIKPFSGFIARHKLYRKSLLYPGDFQLIADETLGANEVLIDPITVNKTYALMGTFYNQPHINKYWFTSSNTMHLTHSVNPFINSMKIIPVGGFNQFDGTKYAIVKADSLGVVNDATYLPYDSSQFNQQSGSSYNSNFIDLKGGALYVLSMNMIMEKDKLEKNSRVQFFFTSSIPDIAKEKNFITPFGLKLGEITSSEETTAKIFASKQFIFFTPNVDYFGTIVVVPEKCQPTISDLSLKVYGDYGFSPDILFTKIPFPINIANESFQFRAELYDINSTLVFSDLQTIQSFDPNGESLFVFVSGSNFDPSKVAFLSGSLTVSQSLFLPNIPSCPPAGTRLLAFNLPSHTPPITGEGSVCFTNISDLEIKQGTNVKDYVKLSTVAFSGSGLVTTTVTPIGIRYSSVDGWGRKIIINNSGSKTLQP